MATSKAQLSALSRLFSPSVFKQLASKGRSPLFANLVKETGLTNIIPQKSSTASSVFETAFTFLRRSGFRDEYVYRSALTHNIVLGRHSLNTASMLTEFRAGECKADLAILNGTGTVYEIKSDRDSLSRLANQIENYQKVFTRVYVIAGDAHLQSVLDETPEEVGVLRLARWNQITTERTAKTHSSSLCSQTMLHSLRTDEARTILRNLGIAPPDVPNTLLRSAISDIYSTINPLRIHMEMISVLKKTRNLSSLKPLIDQLPPSLRPVALSTRIKNTSHTRLLQAVSTPLDEAITWAD